jgi:hypothetical protein
MAGPEPGVSARRGGGDNAVFAVANGTSMEVRIPLARNAG